MKVQDEPIQPIQVSAQYEINQEKNNEMYL